jgi:S-adenosylmethionine/arginine decarboxylase-like enzyme
MIQTEHWGYELQLDLHDCNPEAIRSAENIHNFVIELCDAIEMKRFGEPQIVHFGEDEKVEGYSLVQLIETSLVSGHFANQTNRSFINVFSCKHYDSEVAIEVALKYFGGRAVRAIVTPRD